MSMTKRQKYAELRKSTTLKESHSNEAIKFSWFLPLKTALFAKGYNGKDM